MFSIWKKIVLRFLDLYLYLEEHLGCGGHCLDNALLEMSALVKPYLKKSLSAPLHSDSKLRIPFVNTNTSFIG